jgi:hypothetical protein
MTGKFIKNTINLSKYFLTFFENIIFIKKLNIFYYRLLSAFLSFVYLSNQIKNDSYLRIVFYILILDSVENSKDLFLELFGSIIKVSGIILKNFRFLSKRVLYLKNIFKFSLISIQIIIKLFNLVKNFLA